MEQEWEDQVKPLLLEFIELLVPNLCEQDKLSKFQNQVIERNN